MSWNNRKSIDEIGTIWFQSVSVNNFGKQPEGLTIPGLFCLLLEFWILKFMGKPSFGQFGRKGLQKVAKLVSVGFHRRSIPSIVSFQQCSTADIVKVIRFGTFVRNIGFWCDSTQIWHKVWPISSLTALSRLYSALYSPSLSWVWTERACVLSLCIKQQLLNSCYLLLFVWYPSEFGDFEF